MSAVWAACGKFHSTFVHQSSSVLLYQMFLSRIISCYKFNMFVFSHLFPECILGRFRALIFIVTMLRFPLRSDVLIIQWLERPKKNQATGQCRAEASCDLNVHVFTGESVYTRLFGACFSARFFAWTDSNTLTVSLLNVALSLKDTRCVAEGFKHLGRCWWGSCSWNY